MGEKIAAKKIKKEIKEEEPVFAGMKLKKASVLKRRWTENELEVVELKAHDFEKIPELEMDELNTGTILTKKEKKVPVPKVPKSGKKPKEKEPDTKTAKEEVTEDEALEEPSEILSEQDTRKEKAQDTTSEDTLEKVSSKEAKPSKKVSKKKPSPVEEPS